MFLRDTFNQTNMHSGGKILRQDDQIKLNCLHENFLGIAWNLMLT